MDTPKKRGRKFDFDLFVHNLLEYQKVYGTLCVPHKYVTPDGYKLGRQVNNIRVGNIKLTEQQTEQLNEIGFVWKATQYNFDNLYKELLKYKEEFGDLLVPQKYVTPDGYKLGTQVNSLRAGNIKLTEQQTEQLNEIGFVWKVRDIQYNFDDFYQELLKYKAEFGDLLVPHKYATPDGHKLGIQVMHLRAGGIKLTEQQTEKLNEISFVWKVHQYNFDKLYKRLLKYKEEFGDLLVPQKYVTPDGHKLGIQVNSLRIGKITPTKQQTEQLNEIGFIWKVNYKSKLQAFDFDNFYENYLNYKQNTNDNIIPYDAKIKNYEIGFYTRNIRTRHIKLSKQQKEQLSVQNFLFDTAPLFANAENDKQALLERMLQGDMTARAKVIEKCYKLVKFSALKLKHLAYYKDLLSLGDEELISAVDRFPSNKNTITFLNCSNYVKKYIFTKMKTYIKQNNKEQTDSLSKPIGEDEDGTLEDVIPDKKVNVEQTAVESQATAELIQKFKATLTRSEYATVCLHFGFTKSKEVYTLPEIAEKYNLREEKVEQIYSSALKKLEQNMQNAELNIE